MAKKKTVGGRTSVRQGLEARGGDPTAEERILEAREGQLEALDLSSLMLGKVPSSLGSLSHLRRLNLSFNGLTEIPESIAELTQLRQLDLSDNALVLFPEAVTRLTRLERLELAGNRLVNIPESIGRMQGLRFLDVARSHMERLPRALITLPRFESLDFSGNRVGKLPEIIGELYGLTDLDVSRNKLQQLPSSLHKLRRLRRLRAVGTELTTMPPWLAELPRLESLSLADNVISSLPETVSQLQRLVSLSLAGNQITVIPEALCRLVNLEHLALGQNPLTDLPESIAWLAKLQFLDLNTEILVYLKERNGLSWLVGKSMPERGLLRAIPSSMRAMTALKELYLHGQPRLGLPPEVLGPSFDEVYDSKKRRLPAIAAHVLDYYFNKHQSRPLNEAKMILVGRGGAGKTSLVNRLVHGSFNRGETKTDGICITQWSILIEGEEVRLNIWDFGGQEIMHATHQFFLTKRSLYVLVLNAREGEQEANVEYWLRLIESFGADSPVLIVINKVAEHAFDLDRRGLREKFPAIRGFVHTDCDAQIGLKELRKAITLETDRLEHLRDPFPASWFDVKKALVNLPRTERENFISFARYQELCVAHGVTETTTQETLVGFLHDLGIVVNFRDDPRLAETHVLNPEWVTNGIYRILNAAILSTKRGELCLGDVGKILGVRDYPKAMHLYLLDLMRKFELCYEFYDSEGNYLVPELLGKEQPDLGEFAVQDALRFHYVYNILPEGLLPRFIVRSRALNRDLPRWRTGVVLAWDGNRALVKADIQDRRVSIAITGQAAGRRQLLAVIRADMEHIHRSITKLKAVEQVPVPGHTGLMIDYTTLQVLEREGEAEYKLVHEGEIVRVQVAQLLSGIEDSSGRAAGPIRVLKGQDALRVAFSYSHRDEELRDRLETHLKLLQRQGLVSTWHDRKIVGGEEWKGVIDDNFKRADIVLLLVSADFIASDYCFETELTTSLERAEGGECRVIPVLLRPCDWQSAPFGRLQGFPRNLKPVTSWAHPEEAWHEIAAGVRGVVEELRARRAQVMS